MVFTIGMQNVSKFYRILYTTQLVLQYKLVGVFRELLYISFEKKLREFAKIKEMCNLFSVEKTRTTP